MGAGYISREGSQSVWEGKRAAIIDYIRALFRDNNGGAPRLNGPPAVFHRRRRHRESTRDEHIYIYIDIYLLACFLGAR